MGSKRCGVHDRNGGVNYATGRQEVPAEALAGIAFSLPMIPYFCFNHYRPPVGLFDQNVRPAAAREDATNWLRANGPASAKGLKDFG